MSTEPQHGISWGAGGVLVSATGPSDFENSDPEYGVLGILQGHLLALSPISPSLEVKTPQGSPELEQCPCGDLHLAGVPPAATCPHAWSWLSGTGPSLWGKILLFFWPLL